MKIDTKVQSIYDEYFDELDVVDNKVEGYKTLTIHVNENDQLGCRMNSHDCPGFRAVSRRVPSLSGFYFQDGFIKLSGTERILLFVTPTNDFHDKLFYNVRNGVRTPFEFKLLVPDEVETIDA